MNRTTEAAAMLTVGSHGSSPLPDARDIDLLLYRDLRSMEQRDNKGGTAIIRPLQYVEGVFYSIGNHIKGKDKERPLMTELKEDEEQERVCKGGNDE